MYCSSINNKSIKDECIKTWKKFKEFSEILDPENQDFYFYYYEIYTQNNNEKEAVISQINKIKRFQKLFEKEDLDDKKITKVNEHITKKIKEFAIQKNVSLDFVLMNVKSILNKIYDIKDIEMVMEYCPLKYFVVKIIDKQCFKIEMQFPFLITIINRRLVIDEVNNYFEKEKYLKKLIENDTVKGNYFEEAVKFGLKKPIRHLDLKSL